MSSRFAIIETAQEFDMKISLYNKSRGGPESSRSRTPGAKAPSSRIILEDRIDRAIRGQYKARRYQLMDGAR